MIAPQEHNAGIETDSLLFSLRKAHAKLRDRMETQWHRDLPWNELIGDRWERARRLGFGDGVSIYDNSYIFGDVTVGDHTWIGPFTVLDGTGGLTIGSYCSISAGVQIYTHESLEWALTSGRSEYRRAPVAIGSKCYIGSHAVIRMGVAIGERSVIGANAFVNRAVPPNTIVAGTPARVIGSVADDGQGGVRLVYHPRSAAG